MEWKIALIIIIAIIGYFGMFWALSLSDMELSIDIQMDNNSLEAFKLAIAEQIRQEQQEVVCLNLTNGSVEE